MNIQVLLQAALPLPETATSLKPVLPGNLPGTRAVNLPLPEVPDRALALPDEIRETATGALETGDLYVPQSNKEVLQQALAAYSERPSGGSKFEVSPEGPGLRAPAIAAEPYQHAAQEAFRERNAETFPLFNQQAGDFMVPDKTRFASPVTFFSGTDRGSAAFSEATHRKLSKPEQKTSLAARYLLLFCFLLLLVMIVNRAGAPAGGRSNQSTFFSAR